MEIRYQGFDQRGNARDYRFDCVAKGEPTRHFTVTADIGLFLVHRVGIQEGPTLCAHKLTTDLETSSVETHELTDADIRAYASSVALAIARKAEARRNIPRRVPTVNAYEGSPWRGSRP